MHRVGAPTQVTVTPFVAAAFGKRTFTAARKTGNSSLLRHKMCVLPQTGYREGLDEGKAETIQQGFNAGECSEAVICRE